MKIIVATALIVSFTVVISCKQNQAGGLTIKKEKPSGFVDTINIKDTFYTSFQLYNNTPEEIKIIKVVPSCGCTEVSNFKEVSLVKGESLKIEIKYAPETKDSGLVSKSILIYTNANPMIYTPTFDFFVLTK